MARWKDITGTIYGNLCAIENTGKKAESVYIWSFLCICGNIVECRATLVRKGHTTSCGCVRYRAFPKGQAGFNYLVICIKRSAKLRNLAYTLTNKQVRKLTSSICSYCGDPPSRLSIGNKGRGNNAAIEYGKYCYNGIDRVDNKKGYTIENSTPCCKTCNFMKRVSDVQYFKNHVKKITKHLEAING